MAVTILTGDCRELLATLPAESVNCVVTSPPYWRQRDYGVAGQIGLEQTPEQYIAEMTNIFSEVRRILRPEGTCWINIGDKWASGGNGGGYKDKDLVGIPFMLAFAMRADGWFWRQCNVWAKPNGMPESVSDRSTISHEYVLQFSKQNDYWYDPDAVRLPPTPESIGRLERAMRNRLDQPEAGTLVFNGSGYAPPGQSPHASARADKQRGHSRRHAGFNERWDALPKQEQEASGASLRSVWWIAPANFQEGHFAVMPDALATTCILAGCPSGGTVLDPFGGAGTTGLVADRLQRSAVLIELNPAYAEMARRRIDGDAPLLAAMA